MNLQNPFTILLCLLVLNCYAQQDTIRKDLAISAQANVYYHYMTNPDKISGGVGVKPIAIDVRGIRKITFENASGKVSCFMSREGTYFGPDGGKYGAMTMVSGIGQISGIEHTEKVMFLCGVFTNNNAYQDKRPLPVNYTYKENEPIFAPILNRTFFIGDGLTENGGTQTFYIPSEAETLYIGFADSLSGLPSNYDDNAGDIKITIVLHPRYKN